MITQAEVVKTAFICLYCDSIATGQQLNQDMMDRRADGL
jgi:hypothetical protein